MRRARVGRSDSSLPEFTAALGLGGVPVSAASRALQGTPGTTSCQATPEQLQCLCQYPSPPPPSPAVVVDESSEGMGIGVIIGIAAIASAVVLIGVYFMKKRRAPAKPPAGVVELTSTVDAAAESQII